MPVITEPERLTLDVPEVAKKLGTSERLVYEALRRREIPARKLGGKWIISRERFDQWLNGTEGAA